MALLLAAGVSVAVSHVTIQITAGAAGVDRRSQAQTSAAVALVRIRTELEAATAVLTFNSRQISFRRPDLDGDGSEDIITYEWSGTVDDPVTREINSGGKMPLLDTCRAFKLSAAAPPIRLTAGVRYPLRLEYYENTGTALCSLMWAAAGVGRQIVPAGCLFPAFNDTAWGMTTGTGLTGQYYNNSDFTSLKLTRTDSTINFDWGTGAPTYSMGSDTFSIRWTGQVRPTVTGDYTFYTSANNGVRLWVGDCQVINYWESPGLSDSTGASAGLSRVDIRIETGTERSSVRLDGAVTLLNVPGMGG